MGRIAISDTHRLPYLNARVSAKTVQSGNTTPLKFYDGSGAELGFELRTNAKGYLCDQSGALYTTGVFVHEDAYITVVLGDGTTIGWQSLAQQDVTVNDGKLYGRLANEGEPFVMVGNEKRLLLHSANDANDRPLNFADLAGVPPINEWREDQVIKTFGLLNNSMEVPVYTKTLLMRWEGALPDDHGPVRIYLRVGRRDATNRYAQHIDVKNMSPYRMTVMDYMSGQPIVSLDPYLGSASLDSVFTDNILDGHFVLTHTETETVATDASDLGSTLEIPAAQPDGFSHVELNDRTPRMLVLTGNIQRTSPVVGEAMPIKLDASSEGLKIGRVQRIWNTSTVPVVLYFGTNTRLAVVYPGEQVQIEVPALDSVNTAFTDSFGPVLLDTANRSTSHISTFNMSSGTIELCGGADRIDIACTQRGGTVRLRASSFGNDIFTVAFTTNGFGYLELEGNGAVVKRLMVAGFVVLTVRTSGGGISILGDYDLQGSYSFDNGTWYEDCTGHFVNKLDLTYMGFATNNPYRPDIVGDGIVLQMPFLDAEDADFELVIPTYRVHTNLNLTNIKVRIKTSDGQMYNLPIDHSEGTINGGRYRFAKISSNISRLE